MVGVLAAEYIYMQRRVHSNIVKNYRICYNGFRKLCHPVKQFVQQPFLHSVTLLLSLVYVIPHKNVFFFTFLLFEMNDFLCFLLCLCLFLASFKWVGHSKSSLLPLFLKIMDFFLPNIDHITAYPTPW